MAEQEPLYVELAFDADLADSEVLDELQAWLSATSPRFCATLRVQCYEREKNPLPVDVTIPGSLRRAVLEKGTYRYDPSDLLDSDCSPRRFGSVIARGKSARLRFSVRFDQYVPARPSGDQWLWSNQVVLDVGLDRIDGQKRDDWVRALVLALGTHRSFLWGAAREDAEFRQQNLHNGPDGGWAVGRNVRAHLPGLYWLNVFGRRYLEVMGRQRVLSTPAVAVEEIGSAVAVQLYEHPAEWSSGDGRSCHQRALEHLGQQFFFHRADANAGYSAPDFGLPPLRSGAPLEAIVDGGEIVVLPRPREDRP